MATEANLNPEGDFPSMFEHLGESDAAQLLMSAIEVITSNLDHNTPNLGETVTTRLVCDANIAEIRGRNT
jgi:tartrate dehydrogenase/decarboxylase/D-malate dehydrogenase